MSDLPEYIHKSETKADKTETIKTIGAAVGAVAATGVLVLGLSKMMEVTPETAAHPMPGVEMYSNPPLPRVNQAPVVETLNVPPVVLPPRTQPATGISYNDMPG